MLSEPNEAHEANENPYESPRTRSSRHDPAKRWQFRLPDLLAVSGIAAVLFAALPLWAWLGFLWLTLVGSACGIRFAWRRNRSGAWESILGGSLGGAGGLLATLGFVYTSPEPWEDSGIGFWGCLVMFSPFAVVLGAIFGALVWLVATGARAILNSA